jgi:hypothetical protein
MYTRATSLPNLYIRNIMPDDMSIHLWSTWPYWGGPMRTFRVETLLVTFR